jgi:hypothetical protein
MLIKVKSDLAEGIPLGKVSKKLLSTDFTNYHGLKIY